MATGTEVHHANVKRCVSVMTLRLRSQALTALRLKKPVTSAVVVGKVGHREKIMKIIKTDCTQEQIDKDMPELLQANAVAMKTEMLWEFFGGTLTLENGHVYQVLGQ